MHATRRHGDIPEESRREKSNLTIKRKTNGKTRTYMYMMNIRLCTKTEHVYARIERQTDRHESTDRQTDRQIDK